MMNVYSTIAAVAVATGIAASSTMPANAQETNKSWAEVQKSGILRCGAAVFPPYVVRDPVSGEYSGFFADLCREFAQEVLQVKPEFVDTTWDNIVAGLQAGKWDMSLALNQTPQRALAIAYSVPVLPYEITLAYNKQNPKIPANPKSFSDIDLKDVTIVVVSGTAMEKSVSASVKNAQVLRLPSSDEARLAIMSRRGDILADPGDTNRLFLNANKDWAAEFAPTPALSKQGISFGLPKSMASTDIEALNIFITEKLATGHIKDLVDKSFSEMMKK